MFSIIAFANSLVLSSVAPFIWRSKSYVTRFWPIVFSSDERMRSAASGQPEVAEHHLATQDQEPGFTLSCPAYLGAVPCVASNMACPD